MNSLFKESRCTRRDWLCATASLGGVVCARRLGAATATESRAPALGGAQAAALRGVMQDAIERQTIPGGALAILSRGQVVFRESFGRAAFDAEQPFAVDAPCFIASLTKPISATYFTMLDEQGVISLDDPVEKFLPEFKGVKLKGKNTPVMTTLRVWHLLSHRSGLPGNADLGDARPQRGAQSPDAAASEPGFGGNSLAEVIQGWLKEGLWAEPGERFAYGGSGYMVAARIAEVVLGERYERLLADALLNPLRMTRTTFFPDAETIARLPARYLPTPQGPRRDPRTMPLPKPGGLINPAGGLCSCLDDMAAFLALHLNRGVNGGRRLVAEKSLARMYRPHPPKATEAADGGGAGYGLGWNVLGPGGFVRHLGASGTLAWVDLRRGHAGILLTQVKWGAAKPLIPRLMNAVQAIFPESGGDRPANP